MADLLWECIIISLVLLLGLNIGLAMGLNRLSKGKIISLSAIYGAVLIALTMLVTYTPFLYNIANEIIPYVIGIIGVATLIIGIYTIIKWKRNKNEYSPFASVTMMVPTICSFAGFFFATILLSNKNAEPDFLLISITMAVLFAIIIAIFYLFSNFLRHAERPYPILLGNFMILEGFFFLIAGLFIPNIKTMTQLQNNPLTIDVSSSLFFLLLVGLGVLLVGVYLTREGRTV